jgi:hypothetical protein
MPRTSKTALAENYNDIFDLGSISPAQTISGRLRRSGFEGEEQMDETPPIASEAATPPDKQTKVARWSRIAGVLVAIAALIRLGSFFFSHPGLETCDSDTIQTTIASLVDEQLAKNKETMKFAKLSGIKTLKSDSSLNVCQARIDFTDNTGGQLFYNVTATEVRIDHVTS